MDRRSASANTMTDLPPGFVLDSEASAPAPVPASSSDRPAVAAYEVAQVLRNPVAALAREAELLRRYGYGDAEIAAMSDQQRRARAAEAVENGITVPPAAGTGDEPVWLRTGADVQQVARVADQQHSPAQGEAGNVQRGHASWNGLAISIEAPAGGVRRGIAPDGTPFATRVGATYGYLRGVPRAADRQAPDVFLGPHVGAGGPVYVIDELDPATGAYRQSKSMIGFASRADAVSAYLTTSSKSAGMIGGIRAMSANEFRALARSGGLARPVTPEAADLPGRRRAAIEGAVREVQGEAHPDDVALAAQLMHQHALAAGDALERATLINALRSRDITPHQMESVIGAARTRALFASAMGARRAPDGEYYAPDPARPGKYLKLVA
jgi:hypothetical protein